LLPQKFRIEIAAKLGDFPLVTELAVDGLRKSSPFDFPTGLLPYRECALAVPLRAKGHGPLKIKGKAQRGWSHLPETWL